MLLKDVRKSEPVDDKSPFERKSLAGGFSLIKIQIITQVLYPLETP
jgi:hypothetical protein